MAAQGPTTELGSGGDSLGGSLIGDGFGGGRSWASFVSDILEHVPELTWPASVKTFHTMRNDAQIQGLYLGSTLPIRRYHWFIEPNGARPEVVEQIAKDYNLPIRGQEDQPRGRAKRRFAFDDHLRHALLAIIYGHMFFEQVGEIGPDDLWHLRKLGPRMPHTIQEILVDKRDGGLAGIRQNVGVPTVINRNQLGMIGREPIPVDRLVAYAWEREGGNWTGRSMLRGLYKNWLLKDTTLRVGAINIERAGGVPVITGPKGASPDDLQELAKMARQFRVGEGSGGAIPNGAELNLARAAGGEEAVQFIKLQNEEMGRGWLMMFMNLGQATTGSYALGSSLIDFVLNTQETIATWFRDIFNEHVIEDHIDWNYGEDEPAPLLDYRRNDDRQLALADLAQMVSVGVIQVDDELEGWLREEYKMPRKGATPRPVPVSTVATQAQRGSRAAGGSISPESTSPADALELELTHG